MNNKKVNFYSETKITNVHVSVLYNIKLCFFLFDKKRRRRRRRFERVSCFKEANEFGEENKNKKIPNYIYFHHISTTCKRISKYVKTLT